MMTAAAPAILTRARPWDESAQRQGFGAILYYGAPGREFWGERDAQREAIFAASPPVLARIIRSVAENTPLGMMSDQDGGTWGAARFAGGTDRRLFASIAKAPELRGSPYRAIFEAASTPQRAPRTIDAPGLREAWWHVARQPWAQRIYWQQWAASILAPAISAWKSLGWRSERGLAILARARNSSGAMLTRVKDAARPRGAEGEAVAVEAALARYAAERPLYAERAERIRRDHPMVPIDAPRIESLAVGAAAPRRPSGWPVAPYPAPSPTARAASLAPYVIGAGAVAYLLRHRLRALIARLLRSSPRLKRLLP